MSAFAYVLKRHHFQFQYNDACTCLADPPLQQIVEVADLGIACNSASDHVKGFKAAQVSGVHQQVRDAA